MEIREAYIEERHRLLGFIRSKVASEEDAEDILQDIFTSTIENVSVTRPIENVVGWLYTAARNRITDWYRKKRRVAVPLEAESGAGLRPLEDVLSAITDTPEHAFYRKLIIEELTECLDELPPEQRDVFIWNAVEGKTFREISEATGESINTLLSRKRYAVQFLRNRLKEINEIINQMS